MRDRGWERSAEFLGERHPCSVVVAAERSEVPRGGESPPPEPAERLSFFLWCTLHSRAPQIDEAPVVNQFIRVCITVSLDCFFLRYAKKNAVVENFTLKDYNDPLRSAYRRNRSTDDAVSYVLENIYSHLEKAGSSVVYHDTERQL